MKGENEYEKEVGFVYAVCCVDVYIQFMFSASARRI
jgi:hypothetical protein